MPMPRSGRRKLRLAHAINGVIARRRLTQAAAAEKLSINQPKVSALANYKLDGFSVERTGCTKNGPGVAGHWRDLTPETTA
jgi:Helix-turn-helix domain